MEHAAGHELEPDGSELAAAVHQETQGNPFFIGEMLLHLAESGLIVQREGRWQSDFSLDEVGIPEGIREVVGRRLSRLSDAANTALSIGAVIGPEFDVSLVEALSGLAADELLDALDEAARASIVREVAGAFGRYAFAHALVRSTLYERAEHEPAGAHALAGRRSDRGAAPARPRRPPRRPGPPLQRGRAGR